ncbi:TetR/AcrR family transcriptional regulator [Neobacillus terrae]|uniref:TetR/AcrR family transcriptional regulator n=1 Tax=Neobacillus terrae TaxID=3034837 RepID=UPI001407AEE9|nr:TetR/AcrR family transcriptional regulator [Neobacillus terrae]NHM32096.1 TetR/AcrR family transcriptional regulator [Neobacillus terrae]
MNDRKQLVVKKAHELFIDKGFQATSIQDILDYSGISKGTFYNYFSSKNELLIAVFKSITKMMEQERNNLLIGQDPANLEVFVKQIELQLTLNRKHKLLSLFEEVFVSNDPELRQFIRRNHLRFIHWVYQRFTDLFGEDKKPFLLDCSIMFMGILQYNLKYSAMAKGTNLSIHQISRYSVDRIVKIVEEVSKTGAQLIQPHQLEEWLPQYNKTNQIFRENFKEALKPLLKSLLQIPESEKYLELLEFIKDEVIKTRMPRKFLIQSALQSLQSAGALLGEKQVENFRRLVDSYLNQIKEKE